MGEINIYIDGNNLYRAAKTQGYKINYRRFNRWLCQKYKSKNIYLFIGFLIERIDFYDYLCDCGFILIFKEAIITSSNIKGNCDAEVVLKCVSDFYTNMFTSCILISGDGDFGCLAEFLIQNKALNRIVAPDRKNCSILLKNKNTKITFLNEHYYKFSEN